MTKPKTHPLLDLLSPKRTSERERLDAAMRRQQAEALRLARLADRVVRRQAAFPVPAL